jgi:hypothetical protein
LIRRETKINMLLTLLAEELVKDKKPRRVLKASLSCALVTLWIWQSRQRKTRDQGSA